MAAGYAETRDVFAAGGEGYAVEVTCLPAGDPRWRSLALPYTDPVAAERRVYAIWPHELREDQR